MPKTVSATEARIHLGALLRDVAERGETIIVERSGKPQAVILSIEAYERIQPVQREAGGGLVGACSARQRANRRRTG